MKIINTDFKGLKIFKKETFKDGRGYNRELFHNKLFNKTEKREIIARCRLLRNIKKSF